MARVAVAMSGGVDSSTVFMMLKNEGHEVFGVTMRHLPAEMAKERVGSCCAPSAVKAAERLCATAGVPHYVFDLEQGFGDRVMAPTANGYASGFTPNPCVLCNERVKFDLLFRRAVALGADLFATGHYARVENGILARAVDRGRDQSYFLYRVAPGVLARTIFPLGGLKKEDVRIRARDYGIPMHDKEDSMDVCFAPSGDFSEAFRRHAPEALEPGEIVDEDGRVVGSHEGVGRVTIGQRRGLGVVAARRLFVTEIDAPARRIIVGERPSCARILAVDLLLAPGSPDRFRVTARIRSQHEGVDAEVVVTGPGEAEVLFADPLAGVSPGQSVVFYDGDRVLGGGVIRLLPKPVSAASSAARVPDAGDATAVRRAAPCAAVPASAGEA
jgi:tRNA-uridine 2-sulfurtransferase